MSTGADEAALPALEAPALSRDHIRKELELLHHVEHRGLRSALYARLADPSDDGLTVEVSLRGEPRTFHVIATSGELDLRRKLAREPAGQHSTVYIVPFARQIPRDIEAVLASGRLWLPQIEWLLPRRFGAKAGTPRLLNSQLRRVAQREGTRNYATGEAPSIDLDDAWLLFLRNRLELPGLETEAQLFSATLLDRDRRGKALAALLALVPGALAELTKVLDHRLGPSASLVLTAWLEESSVELAAMAVVGEAGRLVLNAGSGAPYTLLTAVLDTRVIQIHQHPLRPKRNADGVAGLAKALVDLGYVIPLVWQRLSNAAHDPLRRAILGEAEKALGSEPVRALALGSMRLPFVFEHRRRTFIEAIEAVVAAKDTVAVERAIAAVDEAAGLLLAHDVARGDDALEERVVMAERLAAFLGEPSARRALEAPGISDSPRAEIIRLATFQAEIGGYVDWARQIVRSDQSGLLGRDLTSLVAAVDRVRDAQDVRFARAYEQLVGKQGERGILRGAERIDGHNTELLLIEDALASMGLSLLEQGKDLRLLILCMDGMSAANLAELWGSIASTSFVPVSRSRRAAVLAHVPTITKLSRSALFAGRAMASGDSLDTSRDGDRLLHHAVVQRMGETPVVLLKGDIVGPGGGLAADAARAVRGADRIVGVVVNAIDDQLKGSAQLRVELSTKRILPLEALLEAAESTGRLVLLVSDHGNIRSQRFFGAAVRSASKGAEEMERGARYRGLVAGESATPDEIELPSGAFVMPKGATRVAVAVSETLRYTSMLHAGEHGGVSLAEAIAPAVLLAPPGLVSDLRLLGIEEMPLDPPAFWSRDRAPSVERREPEPPTIVARTQAVPIPSEALPHKASQAVLPFEVSSAPGLAEAVLKSPLFRSQIQAIAENDRPLLLRAIQLLVRHGGRLSRDRFAVDLGIDAGGKGVRVPGFVSRLERVLNVDQEPVIAMDGKNQFVELDPRLLRSIFLEDADG